MANADFASFTGMIVYEGDPPEGVDASRGFDVWLVGAPDWEPVLVEGARDFDGHPSPSPDGSRIVYASHVGRESRLYIYDIDRKTRVQALGDDEFGDYPKWTGEGIIYSSPRGWRILNTDTGEISKYTALKRNVHSFTRSRYGKRMIVATRTRNPVDETHLFLTDAEGEVIRQLTDEHVRELHPYWHPTDNRILYSGGDGTRDGRWEVWILDLDSGEKRAITTNEGADWACGWSPDGEWVLITSEYGGNWDIYAIRPDGSERTRVTCHEGNARYATWFMR